jgi:hypothetical protein
VYAPLPVEPMNSLMAVSVNAVACVWLSVLIAPAPV